MSMISSWNETVKDLYKLHRGRRVSLEAAQAIYNQGLELSSVCDLSNQLGRVEADIARCHKFRAALEYQAPLLFSHVDQMEKQEKMSTMTLDLQQKFVREGEDLPFSVHESCF